MCTQPKTIKNPRKYFIPFVDSPYITVPCRECLECRNARRNELFVLAYYEHLQAIDRGGFTQFFTLTYDDAHMPYCNGKPCFSRDDIKHYFVRVTTECKRQFGDDFSFRRLIVCEDQSSGKRDINPHYHFLLFTQKSCNHFKFRKILRDKWYGGFTFGSWDHFGEVTRPHGIRYVTKYVCKDCFELQEDKEVIDELRMLSPRSAHQVELHRPFTFMSKRFGFYSIAHLLDEPSKLPDHMRTSLDMIIKEGKMLAPGKDFKISKVNVPRSIIRGLFYKPTYRYLKVTDRFKYKCLSRGFDIPKKRVQSFYIPKDHIYYDYFHYKNLRRIKKNSENLSKYHFSTKFVSPLDSIIPVDTSDFKVLPESSIINFSDYERKVSFIMCERDPVFERDPFTGEFSYKRAPLERKYFPDLESYVCSNYLSGDFLSLFSVYLSSKIDKHSFILDHTKNEKTIKDYLTLYKNE